MLLNNKHSKLIIKIGSGFNQSKKYSFKAKGLDLAVKNKILVPKGYLITQEFWGNFGYCQSIKCLKPSQKSV